MECRIAARGLRRGSRSAKITGLGCLPGLGGSRRRIERFAAAAPTGIGHPTGETGFTGPTGFTGFAGSAGSAGSTGDFG